MTFDTANAFDIVCQLDRNDTLDEVPQNKKQKVATGLLLDKLHKQDFAGPLVSRASVMESGEVIYEKVYMSSRPPPKISLKHDWKRELGSEDAQRPEGQVGQLSRSFQSNQPIPNPSRDRSGQPVVRVDTRTVQDGRKTSRSQEIDVNSFHEETFFGQIGATRCRNKHRKCARWLPNTFLS